MKKIFVCFFLLLTFPSFALPTEDDLKEFRQEVELCDKMFDEEPINSQDSSVSGTQIIDCYLNAADKATALYYPDYKYIRYDIMEYIKYDTPQKEITTYFILRNLSRMMRFLPKQLQTFKKIEQGLTQKNPAFLNPIFSAPLKPYSRFAEDTVLTDKSIVHSVPGRTETYTCEILENQLLYIRYVCNSVYFKSDDGKMDQRINEINIYTFMPFWITEYDSIQLEKPEAFILIQGGAISVYGYGVYGANYAIWVPSD